MNDEPKPIMAHILALRNVLVRSLFAIIIVMAICGSFAEEIFKFISRPLLIALDSLNYKTDLIYTSVTELFSMYLKLTFYTSLFVCFPYILWQIWKFMGPALLKNESKIALKIMIISPILFIIGATFAFYILIPIIISTLISHNSNFANFVPKVNENISFILTTMLSFGISFQLPLIIFILDKFQILRIATVKKLWREVIITIVLISALLTPPDALSMIFLAAPLICVYLISILSNTLSKH
jgi:sec-independent protein translocase protein TatC